MKINFQEELNAINTLLEAGLIEEDEATYMKNYVEELITTEYKTNTAS